MQGIKGRTSKLFYQFSLEEHISADHPLRLIEESLDLRFLYSRTRAYYGREGQKSIDPVVFFKICLLGYFNNITSDRALIQSAPGRYLAPLGLAKRLYILFIS